MALLRLSTNIRENRLVKHHRKMADDSHKEIKPVDRQIRIESYG